MVDLHLICPKGRNRLDLGDGRFESGFWNVGNAKAQALIGGRIFLHERKDAPSWQGGTIESWRNNQRGKKTFTYYQDHDQNVVCNDGWGQEQATVWHSASVGRPMFWLTYKPLGANSKAGWPREKLSALTKDFKTDPYGTTEWWRLASYKTAQIGDEVVLFKQGEEPRGIFGRGEIVAGPQPRADSSGGDGQRWRVQVRFTELVDPEIDLLTTLAELRDILAIADNNLVNTQASGTQVPNAIAEKLRARLDAATALLRGLADDEADDGRSHVIDTTDQRERSLRAICIRRGQAAFRAALMQAYGGRCAITGCAVTAILEAAHIIPYNGPGTNKLTNGLLLRTDLHTLFDCGLLAIDPRRRNVVISNDLKDSSYSKLAGRRLRDASPITVGPSRNILERAFQGFQNMSRDTPLP